MQHRGGMATCGLLEMKYHNKVKIQRRLIQNNFLKLKTFFITAWRRKGSFEAAAGNFFKVNSIGLKGVNKTCTSLSLF